MSQPSIAVKEEDKMDADAEGESEVSSSEDSDADASGEDDDDPDAQAEAVARLLGDALWADIAKAYETTPISTAHVPTPAERAVLEGIYGVLSELAGDTDAMEAFWSLSVPGTGKSVLELLTSSMRAGSFGVEAAESLATSIDTLLTGRLFGDRVTGKRKRDEDEEGEVDVDWGPASISNTTLIIALVHEGKWIRRLLHSAAHGDPNHFFSLGVSLLFQSSSGVGVAVSAAAPARQSVQETPSWDPIRSRPWRGDSACVATISILLPKLLFLDIVVNVSEHIHREPPEYLNTTWENTPGSPPAEIRT
ncbi:hypothetical protein SISNIDRAFT_466840 [Sistotremastrum niveocremeum HHB9708]|uniref:Uncharacterized protein n=1 Tax=Sistotremastrum niveocremeum HHB9708 TaxID=1314777 RepID=A0A164TL68_9AGAM|nr:hypothetical protein SISNIDRAFT_466840 [Sistotremastrum niveocremeum HHB9708]